MAVLKYDLLPKALPYTHDHGTEEDYDKGFEVTSPDASKIIIGYMIILLAKLLLPDDFIFLLVILMALINIFAVVEFLYMLFKRNIRSPLSLPRLTLLTAGTTTLFLTGTDLVAPYSQASYTITAAVTLLTAVSFTVTFIRSVIVFCYILLRRMRCTDTALAQPHSFRKKLLLKHGEDTEEKGFTHVYRYEYKGAVYFAHFTSYRNHSSLHESRLMLHIDPDYPEYFYSAEWFRKLRKKYTGALVLGLLAIATVVFLSSQCAPDLQDHFFPNAFLKEKVLP